MFDQDCNDCKVGTMVSILPEGTVVPEGLLLTVPSQYYASKYVLVPTKQFTVRAFNKLVQSMCGNLETVNITEFRDDNKYPWVDNNIYYP